MSGNVLLAVHRWRFLASAGGSRLLQSLLITCESRCKFTFDPVLSSQGTLNHNKMLVFLIALLALVHGVNGKPSVD
jgi:hypothetical protein